MVIILLRVSIIEANNVSDDGKSIIDDDKEFTKETIKFN